LRANVPLFWIVLYILIDSNLAWGSSIHFRIASPGFIDTDLNRHIAVRPFLVTAEKGTRIMADQIERQLSFIYSPSLPWTLVAQIVKILPISLLRKM
jgi:hypothetical protein